MALLINAHPWAEDELGWQRLIVVSQADATAGSILFSLLAGEDQQRTDFEAI